MKSPLELVKNAPDVDTALGLMLIERFRQTGPGLLQFLAQVNSGPSISPLLASLAKQDRELLRISRALSDDASDEEIYLLVGNCIRRARADSGYSDGSVGMPVQKGGCYH